MVCRGRWMFGLFYPYSFDVFTVRKPLYSSQIGVLGNLPSFRQYSNHGCHGIPVPPDICCDCGSNISQQSCARSTKSVRRIRLFDKEIRHNSPLFSFVDVG